MKLLEGLSLPMCIHPSLRPPGAVLPHKDHGMIIMDAIIIMEAQLMGK